MSQMDSFLTSILRYLFSPWVAIVLGLVLPVWWSRRCSKRAGQRKNTRKSRYEWSPRDGIYVVMRFGVGIKKRYKTTRVHTIKSATFNCFVPEHFDFDGASIPFWIMPVIHLLDPWRRYEKAAFAHDMLYYFQPVSRFAADATFYDIMFEDDVPFLARKSLYYSVRIRGDKAWRKNTKLREEKERLERAYGKPSQGHPGGECCD